MISLVEKSRIFLIIIKEREWFLHNKPFKISIRLSLFKIILNESIPTPTPPPFVLTTYPFLIRKERNELRVYVRPCQLIGRTHILARSRSLKSLQVKAFKQQMKLIIEYNTINLNKQMLYIYISTVNIHFNFLFSKKMSRILCGLFFLINIYI